VVHDDRADTGDAIEQHQFFSSSDSTLLAGFPKELASDGAGSPAFADVDGDGRPELIIATSDGWVHAFKADGSEARGWPVHVSRLNIPTTGNNAYTRGEVSPVRYNAVLLGSPMVADLNGDGWPEISVTDYGGFLYVWNHDGTPVHGFPVQVNRAYSHVPGCETNIGPNCDEFVAHPVRDHINVVNGAFASQPGAGRIDPSYPGLDLVAGAEDGHVYAWHADGTAVPGWPVMLRDPAKVQSVDPVSHRITFKPGANAAYGRQVLAGVSLGDVNGDGIPEVAVNVDEEYNDPANWSLRDPTLAVLGQVAPPGNTRVYLLQHDGTNHPGTAKVANLGDNAYVPGWPAAIGMIQTELLPDVGSGSDGAPVFATMGGKPVIATASIGSPPYLLNANGSSFYGNGPDGKYLTMASGLNEFKSLATDGPSVASLGGGVFGHIGGSNVPMSFAMGATGLRRLLDVVLPEQQLLAEDHVDAWELQTGTFMPGFPALMNDLQFFNTPIIADVDGDGKAEVVTSSAMYDVRAYGLGGTVPNGWPKSTGGWSVATPAVGDFNGDGKMELALMTRAGELFVWKTQGTACQTREWPKYQHDLHNSGNYATDAEPPAVVGGLSAARSGDSLILTWRAPGDNGVCGTANRYIVRLNGSLVTSGVPSPNAAGSTQSMTIAATHVRTVSVQAQDAAGNLGIPVILSAQHGAITTSTATTKPSHTLAAPSAAAAAKPTGDTRGLLGGLSGLVLLVGLTLRKRARSRLTTEYRGRWGPR
ncbi:MAG TPA: FG-GAP-like repeat-containing protein, partial [Actinomycetota bacterium]|nr:FG-GAP-like repeat-containing protein [Actinomycetota bacterium]